MSLADGLANTNYELSVRNIVCQPALICGVRFTQVEPNVRVKNSSLNSQWEKLGST